MMRRRFSAMATVAAGAILAETFAWAQTGDGRDRPRVNTQMHGAAAGAPAPEPDNIAVPDTFSAPGYFGQIAFERNCATCHGKNGAGGTGKAPPLIHPIYEPGHHPDAAFLRAVMMGVQAHHWGFGDMPPVEGITEKEVELIATYIREIQRANGIE